MIIENYKKELETIYTNYEHEIKGVRANRPNTALIEDIKVSYYDQMVPISHVGSVGVVPPRELTVQVWDQGAINAVAKAIESSSLGLNPQVQGNIVRVFLPELSEERREELVKHIKRLAEDHRIRLRQAREGANKTVQQSFDAHEIGEDEKFSLKENIQKETDAMNVRIDILIKKKTEELYT